MSITTLSLDSETGEIIIDRLVEEISLDPNEPVRQISPPDEKALIVMQMLVPLIVEGMKLDLLQLKEVQQLQQLHGAGAEPFYKQDRKHQHDVH